MEGKLPSQQEVRKEALEILEKHMDSVKLGILVSMLQIPENGNDYLEIREKLFNDQTLTKLLENVKAYELRRLG